MARQVQVFAHRGASAVAPENTLPAFQKALEMGVDGIELDVQCSRDGALVVMHNHTVDATTDGHGAVKDLSLPELRRLDAGSQRGHVFAGTQVPTLEEVLDLVGSRCRVNVEIKSTDFRGGREVEPLVKVIRERDPYDQMVVSSFNPITLIKMRWTDPKIALGLLYSQELPVYLREAWFSPVIAPQALHPDHKLICDESVQRAKSECRAVNTWTVNDVDEARRVAALGVDAIISDVPDAIMAALD